MENLPPQSDSFWKDAENQVFKIGDPVTCEKQKHKWKHVNARQVECSQCHIGFYLPGGAQLKDNHIYINDIQVV